MLMLHWHLYNLHCVVMYTVIACDGGMIMFVYVYVMEVPVINLAFYRLIITGSCKRYPDHSKWLTGPSPAERFVSNPFCNVC